jgi:hypothetical protein
VKIGAGVKVLSKAQAEVKVGMEIKVGIKVRIKIGIKVRIKIGVQTKTGAKAEIIIFKPAVDDEYH